MLPTDDPASPVRRPVLLYDGDCGLCVTLVRWLQTRRRGDRIRYLPLQSPAAQTFLVAHGLPTRDFDSLVFAAAGENSAPTRCLLRTDGLFAALSVLGGPLRGVAWLRVVPRPIRDGIYRLIARFRHRLPLRVR